jgi:hypothetical protein
MRIELEFHTIVVRDLRRWRMSLGATNSARQERYRDIMCGILTQLQEYDGIPPEATLDERAGPTTYLCWFADEVLLRYVVVEKPSRPRGWWDVVRRLSRVYRRPYRRVIVIGLTPRPARREG